MDASIGGETRVDIVVICEYDATAADRVYEKPAFTFRFGDVRLAWRFLATMESEEGSLNGMLSYMVFSSALHPIPLLSYGHQSISLSV